MKRFTIYVLLLILAFPSCRSLNPKGSEERSKIQKVKNERFTPALPSAENEKNRTPKSSRLISLDESFEKGRFNDLITYYHKINISFPGEIQLDLILNFSGKPKDNIYINQIKSFAEHLLNHIIEEENHCYDAYYLEISYMNHQLLPHKKSLILTLTSDKNSLTSSIQLLARFTDQFLNPDEEVRSAFDKKIHNFETSKNTLEILESIKNRFVANSEEFLRLQIDSAFLAEKKNDQYAMELNSENNYLLEEIALIAVGDLEKDKFIDEINTHFLPKVILEQRSNHPQTNESQLEKTSKVAIIELIENPVNQFELNYCEDATRITDQLDLKKHISREIICRMLEFRLFEKSISEHSLFFNPTVNLNISRHKSLISIGASSLEADWTSSLASISNEIERVKRYGFTKNELHRNKIRMEKEAKSVLRDLGNITNAELASKCRENFLYEIPIINPSIYFRYLKAILSQINEEYLSKIFKDIFTDSPSSTLITIGDKAFNPGMEKNEILDYISFPKKGNLEDYLDTLNLDLERSFVELDDTGLIINSKTDSLSGIEYLLLSNGGEVYLKPTKLKNDEILFYAFEQGGISNLQAEEIPLAQFLPGVIADFGLGEFSPEEVRKILIPELLSINGFISGNFHGFSGSSTPEDFETFLQLFHLYLTRPKIEQNKFVNLKKRKEADHFSSKDILSLYEKVFLGSGKYTFVIVGNFPRVITKKRIEKYLASISFDSISIYNDLNRNIYPKEKELLNYDPLMHDASIEICWELQQKMSIEIHYQLLLLESILFSNLQQSIKTIPGWMIMNKKEAPNYCSNTSSVNLYLRGLADSYPEVLELIQYEIDKLQNMDMDPKLLNCHLDKVIKKEDKNKRFNSFWMDQIVFSLIHQTDKKYPKAKDIKQVLSAVSNEDLKGIARLFLDENWRKSEVILPQSFDPGNENPNKSR